MPRWPGGLGFDRLSRHLVDVIGRNRERDLRADHDRHQILELPRLDGPESALFDKRVEALLDARGPRLGRVAQHRRAKLGDQAVVVGQRDDTPGRHGLPRRLRGNRRAGDGEG